MAGPPYYLLRMWRLHSGRSPLARPCDRLETLLITTAVLLALLAIPISATVGSEAVARGLERAHQERTTRFANTATTLEAAPTSVASVGRAAVRPVTVLVAATWPAPDGTPRTGHIAVPPGTPLAAPHPIWVDHAGQPTSPPFQAAEAVSAGIIHSTFTWLAIIGPLGGSCWVAHLILNRHRYALWTREWESLGPNTNHP